MRRFVLAMFAVSICFLALADVASAQTRDFTGVIVRVEPDSLVVANRMGDKVTFGRRDDTAVLDASSGAAKSWKDLAKGDHVTVYWRLKDVPRVARRVLVLPPGGK